MTDAVSLAASTIKLVEQVRSLINSIQDDYNVSRKEAKHKCKLETTSDGETPKAKIKDRVLRRRDIWEDLWEKMDDLEVYLTILSEMLDVINRSSVEFPKSVGLSLRTCANQTSRMSKYHLKLADNIRLVRDEYSLDTCNYCMKNPSVIRDEDNSDYPCFCNHRRPKKTSDDTGWLFAELNHNRQLGVDRRRRLGMSTSHVIRPIIVRFEDETRAFRESVMLFRALVIS